jgi:hypothetical protein
MSRRREMSRRRAKGSGLIVSSMPSKGTASFQPESGVELVTGDDA